MSDKLGIGNEMAKFDQKDRDFYDSLSEEEKKKFSPYMMIRWGSTVRGSSDLQAYYLMSVNERLNKHFFDISTSQHKKFQWLMATTVSPGMGNQRHDWLAAKKKGPVNKSEKLLAAMYPDCDDEDIKLLCEINTLDDIKQKARDMGWDDKKIKEYL